MVVWQGCHEHLNTFLSRDQSLRCQGPAGDSPAVIERKSRHRKEKPSDVHTLRQPVHVAWLKSHLPSQKG